MFRQLLTHNQPYHLLNSQYQQLYFPNINQFVSFQLETFITLNSANHKCSKQCDELYLFFVQQITWQQIKVEQSSGEKSLSFVPFIQVNGKTQRFEFFLSALDEIKQERIKFITRISHSTSYQRSFIEISQSPIHIDQGCNYFLLNAYFGADINSVNNNRQKYVSGNKSRGSKYSIHQQEQLSSIRQLMANLLYMISCQIYVPQLVLPQLLSLIRKQSNHCLQHFIKLSIVHLLTVPSQKKYWTRVSTTAAETKMGYQQQMMMESDIFDEEFLAYQRINSYSNNKALTPKDNLKHQQTISALKESHKHMKSSKLSNNMSNSSSYKYFSRITQLQTSNQANYTQKILQQSSSLSLSGNQSNHNNKNSWYCFQILELLFDTLSKQHRLLSLQQFHQLNNQTITNKMINQIFANYTLSLEQQFCCMDQQPIDQIKQILNKLYQKSLTQFYQHQPYPYFITNPKHQQQSLNKLLSLISQAQSSIFLSINKTKKEMFYRKLSTLDDCYMSDRQLYGGENRYYSKFQNVIGDKIIADQQIGFGLYRESIKQKLTNIFSDFVDNQTVKRTTVCHRKSMNSSNNNDNNIKSTNNNSTRLLISRHAMANNMDKRIEILLSQKRNLQQSLHYEQRLQQNLIEYINGQATYQQQNMRHQIQTISESEENIDQ